MAQLAVSRLHLRGPPRLAFRATTRAEEALRLAAPEGERLLVLRRLALGRLPVAGSPRLWEARTGAALRDAGARAVHALLPNAATAGAVWFASVAEARWLLLRELAAGRWPDAWFWRLAVPGWGGVTLAEWVPLLAARALAEPAEEIALARAVMRLAQAGLLAPVIQALAGASAPARWIALGTVAPGAVAAMAPRIAAVAPRLAAQLLARHSPASRTALRVAICAAPPEAHAARWLARLALLAVAPEALAQRDLFDAMTDAIVRDAASPATSSAVVSMRDPPAAPIGPGRLAPPSETQATTSQGADVPPAGAAPTRAAPAEGAVAQDVPPTPSRPAPGPPALAASPGAEHRTRGAGVLLLVRPLLRMGLPDWLDGHSDLAAMGFARALLRHVARRMRLPPEDALFIVLGEEDAITLPSLDTWRIGLDRWLRRRARRRLVDVAWQPGWLYRTDDSVDVRFAADAADLRLRRQTLDVDPGWVPWLGLAIRYHFRDTPP